MRVLDGNCVPRRTRCAGAGLRRSRSSASCRSMRRVRAGGPLPPARHQRADALSLEAEVRWARAGRGDAAESPGRRERSTQTAGGGASPRQPDPERPPPKKRVRPAQRRAAVRVGAASGYGLSERRACRLVGIGRSTLRYWSRARADDGAMRQRLRELAAVRPRFGYRRLHVLLRREGVIINHKRVERLYREEGLAVRRRSRKRVARDGRGRAALPRTAQPAVGDRLRE